MSSKTWLNKHEKKSISFLYYCECNTIQVGTYLEGLTTARAEDFKKLSSWEDMTGEEIKLIYMTLAWAPQTRKKSSPRWQYQPAPQVL